MTYCLAIRVKQGLVFASDSRTSAGVDDVRTHGKLHRYEFPGEKVFVLLTAGNLGTTQAVVERLQRDLKNPQSAGSLRTATSVYDAAEYVGRLSVRAQKSAAAQADTDAHALEATFIVGGQVAGEPPALFLVYPIGNCISTSPDTPFLQIGESKYGKPILDRIVRPALGLEDAARCALVSLDSTMRSNVSVGPPLEVLMLRDGALEVGPRLKLDADTPYLRLLRDRWACELEAAFRGLPKFEWETPADAIGPAAPSA